MKLYERKHGIYPSSFGYDVYVDGTRVGREICLSDAKRLLKVWSESSSRSNES